MDDKNTGSRKKRFSRAASALLAVLLMLTLTAAIMPAAYAEGGEETPPAETIAPSEEPQQSETPVSSEEPQPSEEPQTSEEPLPAESSLPAEDQQVQTTVVNGHECAGGEILVKFKKTVTDTNMARTLAAADSSVQQELPMDNLVVTDVPQGETVESFIETMESQPDVEFAQPNYVYHVDTTVNDPYATAAYQWHLGKIGANNAWDITMGSSDIKVAVIDTGIDLDHPDLAGKIYAQYDFVNGDNEAQDDEGHGTHVAGIIAANANNGIGVAGVAPGVSLIAVKVLDEYGEGYTDDCISGIYYAADNGADVINMSFGGYGGEDYLEQQAVDYAVSKGVVCVAAAGNYDTSEYSTPSDIESCISVMATDRYDNRADYSDYGPYKDISAPGSGIFSTYNYDPEYDPENSYIYLSGTSMAAPVVSGVAALILSVNPNLSVAQVKDILYSTAVDLGTAGKDYYYGYGRVDAAAAVYKATMGTPVLSSATAVGYNRVDLEWEELSGASGYELWRSTSANGAYNLVAPNLTETYYSDTGLTPGTTYYYKIRAYFIVNSKTVYSYLSLYKNARPVPLAPEACSASEADYDSIKIEWSPVTGATGYMVYRSGSEDGAYTRVTTTSRTYYTNNYVATGASYYYKVCAYHDYTSIYGDYSPVSLPVATRLPDMGDVTVATYYPTAIKISWKAVPGRTKYEIWRSDTEGVVPSYYRSTYYTYYNDTGLTVDKKYFYQVWAYRLVGGVKVYNVPSEVKSDTAKVFQVKNLKAAMYTVTSNKIIWSSAPGASGYEVYRCNEAGAEELMLAPTTSTYYYDRTITPEQTYHYKVRAYRNTSEGYKYGDFSDVIICESKVPGIKAVMYSVNSNKISWSPVAGRYKYEIWRSDAEGVEPTFWAETSYTYYYDRNTDKTKTYYYKVKAYVKDADWENVYCGFSDTVSVENKVAGAAAACYSYSSNKITWNPVAGRTAYELYRCDDAGNIAPGALPLKVTGYTYYIDTGLTTDATYNYRVRAYQKIGYENVYTNFSDKISAKPVLKAVSGARAYRYNSSTIKLTWYSVPGAVGYEIQRSTTGIEGSFEALTTTPLRYYYDGGRTAGTKYYYRIRAYRTGGTLCQGDWSAVVNATP